MNYSDFRKEQENFQLAWRERQNISKDYGYQNRKQYPHIVPRREWTKTIWQPLEKDLIEYIKKEDIHSHTGTHNLLSSWVLCSNLYFGTICNDNFRELFRQFLEKKLETKIEQITKIDLEFAFDDELSPKELLGEKDGMKGSGQTSPDLAILYSTNGKKGAILVECKYTEKSFYNCSGRKANPSSGLVSNPNPKKCKDNETMTSLKNNCHLYVWERKYWEHLSISEYGLEKLNFCPAYLGGYQLVRQQALAEGITKSGKFKDVVSCVAYDARNEKLMQCMKGNNINSIVLEWAKLFKGKSKFSVWEHQDWVDYVRGNCNEKFGKAWIKYIEDRYKM